MQLQALLTVLLFAGVALPVYGQRSVNTEWEFDFSGVVQQVSHNFVQENHTSIPSATFKLGALFDARGFDSHSLIAVRAAVDHWNADARKLQNGISYKLYVEDTHGNPIRALAAAKKLYAEGVRVIIGPSDSLTLDSLKRFSQEKSVVFISTGSTSPALSQEDNIFRNIIDDKFLAAAASLFARRNGLGYLVSARRNDFFGNALNGVFRKTFFGKMVDVGSYEEDASPKTVLQRIQDGLKGSPDPMAAVALIGWEEAAPIALAASQNPSVWANRTVFVFTQNHGVVPRVEYAKFAAVAKVVNVGYNSPDSSFKRWAQELLAKKGLVTPDDFSYLAFDSAWLALSAFDYVRNAGYPAYKNALSHLAGTKFLCSGAHSFNSAGDRDNLSMKIEALTTGPTPKWDQIASYDAESLKSLL